MIALFLFLALNFILQLPRYFFNRKSAAFFPLEELFKDNKIRISALLARFNEDVFRVNLEFTLFVFFLIFFKENIPVYYAKFGIELLYFCTFVLFYYHYSIYGIYKTYPAISSDYNLINQGISIAYNGFKKALFIGVFLFTLFVFGLFYLNSYLVSLIYLNDTLPLKIICSLICIATISFSYIKKINPFRFNKEYDFHYLLFFSVQMSTFLINSNRYFSKKAKEDIQNIPNSIKNTKVEIPENCTFIQKPNIYFIAIESYGAILYENDIYAERYQKLVQEINNNLIAKKWQAASVLSNATVSGGKSWVSYSSFLKGIAIKSDSIYRQMFAHRTQFETQSIFDILEKIGYQNYLVSGLGGFESYVIDWEGILSFLGTKNVIKYSDINYKGVTFNLGPSAPDQYTLNKAIQMMKEKNGKEPISFFMETINSHYNFDSPSILLENWQLCQTATLEDYKPLTKRNKNEVENYFLAIEYQLKMIEDVILKEDSNTIFVLFGDHQPPILTSQNNSYKTPIHIISKDEKFIQEWIPEGFVNSLYIKNYQSKLGINHQDIKRLFVDKFVHRYKEK